MSVNYSSSLIAGVTLEDFFTKNGEKVETFDEFDRKGNKTGKQFKEVLLVATLPDGNEIVIGKVNGSGGYSDIVYDFYTSLGFDGEDSDQTTLKLYQPDYTDVRLDRKLIGLSLCYTDDVEKIEVTKLNETIIKVRTELEEKFGYKGIVNLYVTRNVS